MPAGPEAGASPYLHPLDTIYNGFTGKLTQDQITRIAQDTAASAPGTSVQDLTDYINQLQNDNLVGTPGSFNGQGPVNAAVDAIGNFASGAASAAASNAGSILLVAVVAVIVVIVLMKVL